MKIVLIALIIFLSACKTYDYADSDFPEPTLDWDYMDTLQVLWGNGLVQDSGFTFEFEDTAITKAFLDSLINEHHKQDSIKRSKLEPKII